MNLRLVALAAVVSTVCLSGAASAAPVFPNSFHLQVGDHVNIFDLDLAGFRVTEKTGSGPVADFATFCIEAGQPMGPSGAEYVVLGFSVFITGPPLSDSFAIAYLYNRFIDGTITGGVSAATPFGVDTTRFGLDHAIDFFENPNGDAPADPATDPYIRCANGNDTDGTAGVIPGPCPPPPGAIGLGGVRRLQLAQVVGANLEPSQDVLIWTPIPDQQCVPVEDCGGITVPEPTSMALMGSGLVGLTLLIRRRRNQRRQK